MELQEIKMLWEQLSTEIEKQKRATDAIIIRVTKSDYRNKITHILVPEAIGGLICILGGLFILINFHRLSTWYLVVCGIFAMLILCILPYLSIRAILNIRSVNIGNDNYKQSLLAYSKAKMQFAVVQKLSFYMGAILVVVALPVMGQLISGKDLFAGGGLWFWYTIGFPFFYILSRWVSKRYNKLSSDAKAILQELESY
jgi:hypothetical protein